MSQTPTKEESVPSSSTGPSAAEKESSGSEIGDLEIAWRNGHTYWVWSERELQNAYLVSLAGESATCTCEHGNHNQTNPAACRHVKKAITVLPSEPNLKKTAFGDLVDVLTDVYALRDEQRRLTTGLEADSEASQRDSGGTSTNHGVDPEDAAGRLQEAYDTATSGMKAEAHEGNVWINKSPDAPDWTFDAFIKDPEAVNYDPDESPKQYFQNYIEPGDVDDYIEEVLE